MASSPPQIIHPEQVGEPVNAFQQSSPLSLRHGPSPSPPATEAGYPHDYNFSGAADDETTSGAETEGTLEEEDAQPEELHYADQRIFSGCSSISSFPASMSQHIPREQERYVSPRTPTRRDSARLSPFEGDRGPNHSTNSPRSVREYPSPFRHPSSVRALQMRDEIMSDTHSVLRHHRRSGSQMSSYSQRSAYSAQTSPTKRSSRSYRSSPSKGGSNLKKEFPLVLLHCTLLPPKITLKPGSVEDSLILESLPDEYKQRWTALRNKLADAEISNRGVLISHPREDMALLEERILESLELEKPRIRHDHYFQSDGGTVDSGFESAGTEDDNEENGSCDIKCPDCGSHLRSDNFKRKWEVKVFAANGLMRAGAWAAAWQEMEKVDVEINVWMQEDIRQELDAKLTLLVGLPQETTENESSGASPDPAILREREIYGEFGTNAADEDPIHRAEPANSGHSPVTVNQDAWAHIIHQAREFSRDKRNLLLGVLSCLVLWFAMTGSRQQGLGTLSTTLASQTAHKAEVQTTTITSTSTEVSTALVTASVIETTPVMMSSSQQKGNLAITTAETLVEQPLQTDSPALEELPRDDGDILEAPQQEEWAELLDD